MENEDFEREKYYRNRSIELQKGIVNFKSSSTNTSKAYIWTYRTTACDVLSVITTTVPVKNGMMNEINIETKKVISYKRKSKFEVLKDSPFQHAGLHIDQEAEKKKLNKLLLNEKKLFMAKLNVSRYLRTKLENEAAAKIQAIYRGHYTRSNISDIRENVLISKQIRANIKSYLANRFNLVLSLSNFKMDRMRIRNRSAAVIQAKFISYLSRRALRRRHLDFQLRRRHAAATVIQAKFRGVAARCRVRVLLERLKLLVTVKSAIKIQTSFRRLLAQRKVRRRRLKLRFLASRMIQNWYRAKFSKRMASKILETLIFRRRDSSARSIQRLVRRFLAKRRVNRIRFRSLFRLVFRNATKIQCLIRKFVATAKVKRLLAIARSYEPEKSVSSNDSELLDADAKALLDSVDIFLQASLGKTTDVEDIFKGLSTTEVHTSSDTNSDGDTVLTIAVKTGNMDLVRKCIQWGFDVNHKNDSGCNALMLAVKHNHFQIMQYIIHPPLADDELELMIRLRPISESDAGFLLVAAGANAGSGSDLSILTKLLTMGLNVNAVDESTGLTAIQSVCEVGSYEAFMLLIKNKAETNINDDLGQSLLHKAAGSSLKIVQALLGLDPKCPIYMTEEERAERIAKFDSDGKDCMLHAILGGQTEVIDLFEPILTCIESSNKPDISWSPTDIDKAIRLVETGNLVCISKLLEVGFDAAWQQQPLKGEGSTLSMVSAACKVADLDCLDLLLSSGADFSQQDAQGRIAMHYAASSNAEAVSYLLSHESAWKCHISELSLVAQDKAGNNSFHLAAQAGVLLVLDHVPKAIAAGINAKNFTGQTPLVVACKGLQHGIVQHYLNHGADPKAKDDLGRDCLWQIFASRREACSELNLVYGQESEEDMRTLHTEILTVLALLRNGCRLYSEESFSVRLEDMTTALGKLGRDTVSQRLEAEEPGDMIIQNGGITVLRDAMDIIPQFDCWRLILSSLYYDVEGNLKVFQSLMHFGALQHLTEKIVEKHAALRPTNIALESRALRASDASPALTIEQINQLLEVHFLGVNLVGWMIKFKHSKGLQMLLEKGLDPSRAVDKAGGNNCLHFIARYGTTSMADSVLKIGKCKLEGTNNAGETCAMVAAKAGNIPVARKLFALRASARRALDGGSYRAWVLAFVRRQEATEKSTQTGRTGEYDERWLSIAPDPSYIMWYGL